MATATAPQPRRAGKPKISRARPAIPAAPAGRESAGAGGRPDAAPDPPGTRERRSAHQRACDRLGQASPASSTTSRCCGPAGSSPIARASTSSTP